MHVHSEITSQSFWIVFSESSNKDIEGALALAEVSKPTRPEAEKGMTK